jgi:hypothetical protein
VAGAENGRARAGGGGEIMWVVMLTGPEVEMVRSRSKPVCEYVDPRCGDWRQRWRA